MPFDKSDKQFLEGLITQRVTPIATGITNAETRLLDLEGKLAATEAKLAACEQIIKAHDNRISAQDLLITTQQTKLAELEKRLTTEAEVNKTYRKLVNKLEGEIDDLEQYGRRYCARVFNIENKEDETEEELFTSLKQEMKKVDFNLQRGDLANFHRLGKVKKNDKGPDTRQVILKFHKWAPPQGTVWNQQKGEAPGEQDQHEGPQWPHQTPIGNLEFGEKEDQSHLRRVRRDLRIFRYKLEHKNKMPGRIEYPN